MRRNRLIIGVGVLIAVLAIGAVACDDNGDGDGGETPPVATEPTPTEAESAVTEAAPEDATVIVTEHPDLGSILTDAEGRTLYRFANDEPGVSNCADACVDAWPLLTEDGEPTAGEGIEGELTILARDDGAAQVMLDGTPLYYFSGDAAPGETNGHEVGGVWFVIEVE